jgi:(2R)-3-sulfolactate dehydrogenase (NADP+)
MVSSILEQPSTRLPGNKRLEKRKLRESSQSITISKELFEKISKLS